VETGNEAEIGVKKGFLLGKIEKKSWLVGNERFLREGREATLHEAPGALVA
jgi:hypothetical protein